MTIELAWGLWGGLNRLLFSSGPALPVVRRLLVVVVSGIAIVSGIAAAKAQVQLPAERVVVELRAKQQRKEGDVFIAEGDVDIRFQDLRLRADRVEYNDSTSVAIARGNVKFDIPARDGHRGGVVVFDAVGAQAQVLEADVHVSLGDEDVAFLALLFRSQLDDDALGRQLHLRLGGGNPADNGNP